MHAVPPRTDIVPAFSLSIASPFPAVFSRCCGCIHRTLSSWWPKWTQPLRPQQMLSRFLGSAQNLRDLMEADYNRRVDHNIVDTTALETKPTSGFELAEVRFVQQSSTAWGEMASHPISWVGLNSLYMHAPRTHTITWSLRCRSPFVIMWVWYTCNYNQRRAGINKGVWP